MELKYNCDIDNNYPYKRFLEYLKICNISDFKQSDDFNFMTEHLGEEQLIMAKDIYNKIKALNMVSLETIQFLLKKNDMYGNPEKYYMNEDIGECSPNSVKYVYFGLLNIQQILQNNLSNFDIIEIGGGYGGQCIILLELLKIFNIQFKKYILIDLDEVVIFQKKYITAHNMEEKCKFVSFEEYKCFEFSNNSYLFSSYSLSELLQEIRQDYYNHLFKYISHGFIMWNNNINNIDVPVIFTIDNNFPNRYCIGLFF